MVMFVVSGCATSGTLVSEKQTMEFQEGVTTEQEIREKLGEPTTIVTSGKGRTLIYTGATYQTKAATFVPIVGLFAGGADTRSTSVTFIIGPDGKMQEMTRSETNLDTTTRLK